MILMKLLPLAIFLWLYILWRRRKYYMLAYKLPGPWGYPLIGMASQIFKKEDTLNVFKHYEELFNNCGLAWLGPIPFLIVAEPQIAHDILHSPNCLNRSDMFGQISEILGNGLLTSRDAQWNRHRKFLNPGFKNKAFTNFFTIFNEETEKLLTIFKDFCGRGEIDILQTLKTFTLSITTRTMMDGDGNAEMPNTIKKMLPCYDDVIELTFETIMYPWLWPTFFRKIFGTYGKYNESKLKIEGFIKTLIDQKIARNKALPIETSPLDDKSSFINIAIKLYQEGNFTYENVYDEANVMVVASFETSSNIVLHSLILLAMFPEYQQKLFEEISNIYPEKENFNVTAADIQQMVYLDMVVNEVLRLLAPIPIITREVSGDFVLSNGVTIPKGVQIGIDIFNMQRRKDIWGPDAHTFNPEHFLPSNMEGIHSAAFMPFSKGPRNCIGWRYASISMKVVLIKLIRNYCFKTNFKFEKLECVHDLVIKFKETPGLEISQRDV